MPSSVLPLVYRSMPCASNCRKWLPPPSYIGFGSAAPGDRVGDLLQLSIENGHQLAHGVRITRAPGVQQNSNVTGSPSS